MVSQHGSNDKPEDHFGNYPEEGVSRVSHAFTSCETGFSAYLCGILKTVSLFRSISLLREGYVGGGLGEN
jgi:hypothetical protein